MGGTTVTDAAMLGGTDDPRFESALVRARRHSRHVRWMRGGLPALAVVTLAGLLGAAWVARAIPEGFSLDAFSVEGGELVMTEPSLVGFDERDQPYRVDAARATQSVADPDKFSLEDVEAEIPLSDGTRVTVTSSGGDYDRGTERLVIPEPFTVELDDGTVANFSGGTVDVGEGTFDSSGRVDMLRREGRIEADALSVNQSGRSARFTGNVRVTIEPGSPMAPPTLRGTTGPDPSGTDAPDAATTQFDEAAPAVPTPRGLQ